MTHDFQILIKKFAETIHHSTGRLIEDGEMVMPHLIIVEDNQCIDFIYVSELMNTISGKDAVAYLMRELLQPPEVVMVALVTEAWVRIHNAKSLKTAVPPSEDPLRSEAVIVSAMTKTESVVFRFAIQRNPSRLVWAAPDFTELYTGRFAGDDPHATKH